MFSLDATYLKVREPGPVVSMAALVATGVAVSGKRRVLGVELSAGNDEGSARPMFIRSRVGRGLHGVRLVISDDHVGWSRPSGCSSWDRAGRDAGFNMPTSRLCR